MSRGSSILVLGLAALGAAVVFVYNRRASAQLAGAATHAALAPGSREVVVSGGTAMQTTPDTSQSLPTPEQGGLKGILAQIQSYIDSARAQLDMAIAEGQTTAAQTRQDLETRFAQAKRDPQSARSAFQ